MTVKELPAGRTWQKGPDGSYGLWLTAGGRPRFIRADLPKPTSRYVVVAPPAEDLAVSSLELGP